MELESKEDSSNMLSMPAPPAPTDLTQFKLANNSPPSSPSSASPATSPPASALPPSSLSMVSMASMLSRPPMGFPGMPPFPPGFPSPKDFASLTSPRPDFPLHGMLGAQGRPYTRSPPPMVCPNDPTANDCKIVDYRGEKIAAFMIGHKTMLCLPQVFELFLKNLVGGLHTVYTKCKRLELTPMICNVEQVRETQQCQGGGKLKKLFQVRVLRGLGAIQPGVNRCKLIADCDFDTLYKDCTTSR